jgi:hypothetical protein
MTPPPMGVTDKIHGPIKETLLTLLNFKTHGIAAPIFLILCLNDGLLNDDPSREQLLILDLGLQNRSPGE